MNIQRDTNKSRAGRRAALLLNRVQMKLGLVGGADGAGASAGTAVDASIGVDLILGIAGGDGADRASALASTAHDAGIRDLISHDSYLHFE